MSYTFTDLVTAYTTLGVTKGRTVLVNADLGRLRTFETPGKKAILDAHFSALRHCLGDEGTIVVPTASPNLCNTDIVFDPATTPSFKMGIFSEYVRQKEGSERSFHPFVSHAAHGSAAKIITKDCSRHAFGPNSTTARMLEQDAIALSIGLHPSLTCSTIHHIEMAVGVPYRYVKEFIHPVRRQDKVTKEPFYRMVWYREIGRNTSHNRRIFAAIENSLNLRKVAVGRSHIYSYPLRNFVELTTPLFLDNIYIWCEDIPEKRPWQI